MELELRKKHLDKKDILACAIDGILIATGILFLALMLLQVEFSTIDHMKFLLGYVLLSTGIWGLLLCRNC